jgi:prolyl-tRNA synthetase
MESIEDVSKYLNVLPSNTVKALLMNVNNELVAFFIRGDREFNESKAASLFGVTEINFADDNLISTSNAVPGFTGPKDLNIKTVIDEEVLSMKNFVIGANKSGYHYINANIRDIKYDMVADISNVIEGDLCPECNGKLYFKKGIEIGNLFKLGTKYSEHLGLTYLDEENKEQYVTMGCYGIGIGRILASVIEQHNDDAGMILPVSIAPYQVIIVPVNTKDETIMDYANKLYKDMRDNNIDVMLDDRDERAGVKFNDADLIGIPLRITIGKKLSDGLVEVKSRSTGEITDVRVTDIIEFVQNKIKEMM